MATISDLSVDLSVIFYTANALPWKFAKCTQDKLLESTAGLPLICVSKKPMLFGDLNIQVDTPRSYYNIYRDALTGVRAAKTRYVALCEDDVLYSPEHFKHRPSPGKFAYNLGAWSLFTWGEPMFTHKGTVRRNLNSLICERDLFIEAMEERFAKHPDPESERWTYKIWSEPGKYEGELGVTVRDTEDYYTNPPNIVFSHQTELSFEGLGTRKRMGEFRAYNVPYWGEAKELRKLYENL